MGTVWNEVEFDPCRESHWRHRETGEIIRIVAWSLYYMAAMDMRGNVITEEALECYYEKILFI